LRGSAVAEWVAFAIVAAIAGHFVALFPTPIDRALPFIIVLMCACGFVAERFPAVFQIAVLLLLVPAIFLADEHTRLLAYGVIAAGTFAFALAVAPKTLRASLTFTVIGVLLLRWIPFSQVIIWRELLVLLGAIAVMLSARARVPAPHALAVALATPIFPARMLLFPFLLAILLWIPVPRIATAGAFALAAYFARYSIAVLCVVVIVALISRPGLLYAVAIGLFALWPWSGIVARAFPAIVFAEPASRNSVPVWMAIDRGQSVSIDVPPDAHGVTITASASNATALSGGRVVGWVGGKPIRIGDIADFGFTRREHFFSSRNRPPRTPLADIHDYGASAWLHTAGRIRMPLAVGRSPLTVGAAADLPPGTKLQIEAVEFE
jgi:hypothetical protein